MASPAPIPLSRPVITQEMKDAVCRVLDSGRFVLGDELAALEKEFAAYVGVGNAVGISSGTDALHLALKTAGIGPGDEVVTVPNTFISTALAISYTGASVRLVDVDRSYTMDPSKLEAAITPRTQAVIPVHLYGHTCDMDPIREVTERHGLFLLEDACQSHGATYKGARTGSLGDAGCFSFYPSKNMTVAGEGGMFVTDDDALAEKVRLLRAYGANARKGIAEVLGYNAKLCEMYAAIARIQLRMLDGFNDGRRKNAALYDELLGDAVVTPRVHWGTHVYHLYVIRHPDRDALRAHLKGRGISCGIHYPVPVHRQPCMDVPGSFPEAEGFAKDILSLPMSAVHTAEEIERVCAEVRKFVGSV